MSRPDPLAEDALDRWWQRGSVTPQAMIRLKDDGHSSECWCKGSNTALSEVRQMTLDDYGVEWDPDIGF